jgi:diguanylate cyclase (GGDEF)-like protein
MQPVEHEATTQRRLGRWLGGGIGRRLFAYILLFSALITLALTAVQMHLEYRRELATVEARILELERSSLDSMGRALWNLDLEQLRLQLEGIRRLPDVTAVTVTELRLGDSYPAVNLSLGTSAANARLRWNMPIFYEDAEGRREVGALQVEASQQAIEQRLRERALLVLGTQAVQTFLVALFILLLVHFMVTRHLVALARLLAHYDVRSPRVAFRLQRVAREREDEIDQVVNALEDMRGNLERAYSELSETNAELERDIVARRRAEATAAHLAHHDALTDLPNRRLLFDRLRHELSLAQRGGTHGALLFIDLDHFKTINDTRGHLQGDAILVEASQRLRGSLRDTDLVARLGGDEFVVVLAALGQSADGAGRRALRVAEKLREAMDLPMQAGEHTHHLSASIGVVMFPADGADIETLLKHADIAMYHAKEEGRNCIRFFRPELHTAIEERHELETALRQSLRGDGLHLVFQPLFDRHGALLGAETLIRWQHPERGAISPAQFIPICEESGLIVELGYWVLRHAAVQLQQWNAAGLMHGRYLSVNISPRQFRQADFVDNTLQILAAVGVQPEQLVLEITEGVVMGDIEATIKRISAMRRHGLRFFIDDFGTGYSSMAYLKRLPVDGLKIDQSFVRDLKVDDNDAAIVEAVIAIGQRFRLTVVAEGVENEAQREFLSACGCAVFQGYLLGRPVGADEFRQRFLDTASAPAKADRAD